MLNISFHTLVNVHPHVVYDLYEYISRQIITIIGISLISIRIIILYIYYFINNLIYSVNNLK